MSPILLAVTTFGFFAMACVAIAMILRSRDNPIWARLRAIVQPPGADATVNVLSDEGPTNKVEKALAKLGARSTPVEEAKPDAQPLSRSRPKGTMRELLVQAGFRRRSALAVMTGTRLALGIGVLVVGGAVSAFSSPLMFAATMAFAVTAYTLPSIVVGRMAASRRDAIRLRLPDALDLLLLCVEAGLGLNAALSRVAEERASTARRNDPISEELLILSRELQVGLARREAFRNFADRSGVDDVRALAAQLIQSERLGSSIAQALRAQSETIRTQRRLQAEEAANKTQIKLLFPLLFFIFPALFVVTLMPAMLRILDGLAAQ